MRFPAGAFLVLVAAYPLAAGETPQTLRYAVEWRLIRAGTVTVESQKSHILLRLESAGLVSSLFKIQDVYNVDYDESSCATSSVLDSMEGKRHHDTRVTYDRARNHAFFVERDVLKNTLIRETGTDIPNCVSDVLGALHKLRGLSVEPGQTAHLPVSDGRRSASVTIAARQREEVTTPSGTYKAIRYEADLLNGVVYTRKGHVEVWLSDDERKLPVQIRLRLSFPIGSVTLALEKEEHP